MKRGRALLAAGPCGAIVSWAERIAGQAERKSGPGGVRAAVGRRGENEPALGWCGPGRGEGEKRAGPGLSFWAGLSSKSFPSLYSISNSNKV